MKISFLCSSMEPGRDGVGDYVAQFARALARRGLECQIVALCDRYVSAPAMGSLNGAPVELVRLPARHWQADEIGVAEAALRRFDPDWTSLQMVSYGYEQRGLLLWSGSRFERLRTKRARRHLMLHELWIGESLDYGLKDRAVGWLQKKLLLRALRSWAPEVIHTSNPTYRELLLRNGVVAAELPLPGNIRIAAIDARLTRRWVMQRAHLEGGAELFLAGVFGALHPYWSDSSWADRLARACASAGRRLVVLQIGRKTEVGAQIWSALKAAAESRVRFVEMGEMNEGDISIALQGIDLGISTSAWAVVGKSGAVATMLEHGLPVAVPRTEHRLRIGPTPEPSPHPRLYRFDDHFLSLVATDSLLRVGPYADGHVYERFLASLPDGREGASEAACASPVQ
jgi:hypothetical protein